MDYQKKYLKYKKKYSFLKQKGGIPPKYTYPSDPRLNFYFDEYKFEDLICKGTEKEIIEYLENFDYIDFITKQPSRYINPEPTSMRYGSLPRCEPFYLRKFKNNPEMILLFIDKYFHENTFKNIINNESIIFSIEYIITNILPLSNFNDLRREIIFNIINKLITIYTQLDRYQSSVDGVYMDYLEKILAKLLISIIITNTFTKEEFFELWDYINNEKNINTSIFIIFFYLSFIKSELQGYISDSEVDYIDFNKIDDNFLVEFLDFGFNNKIVDKHNNTIIHLLVNIITSYSELNDKIENNPQQSRVLRRRQDPSEVISPKDRLVYNNNKILFNSLSNFIKKLPITT